MIIEHVAVVTNYWNRFKKYCEIENCYIKMIKHIQHYIQMTVNIFIF